MLLTFYVSHIQAANGHASLCKRTVSTELLLFEYPEYDDYDADPEGVKGVLLNEPHSPPPVYKNYIKMK